MPSSDQNPPDRPVARRPPLAVRLGFALFVILTASLSGEMALRFVARATARMPRAVDPDAVNLPEFKNSLEVMQPNVRGRFFGRYYQSNSEGFRGPEVSEAKPPGTFRIMTLGDSFTNGQGVRYEESYPALLSRALNGNGDDRRYEVINLGIGGFNLRASVDRLEKKGLKFAPDLIVYGFTINDLEGNAYRKSRIDKPWAATTPSRLLNLFIDQWNYFRDLFWHAPGSYLWELDDNYFRNPLAWEGWKADLRELKDKASQQDACLLVFLHTDLMTLNRFHPPRAYYDAVEAAATELGIPYKESFPYYLGKTPQDLWVNFYDRHPNPAGHAILAQSLEDGLKALPASCWKGAVPKALPH